MIFRKIIKKSKNYSKSIILLGSWKSFSKTLISCKIFKKFQESTKKHEKTLKNSKKLQNLWKVLKKVIILMNSVKHWSLSQIEAFRTF